MLNKITIDQKLMMEHDLSLCEAIVYEATKRFESTPDKRASIEAISDSIRYLNVGKAGVASASYVLNKKGLLKSENKKVILASLSRITMLYILEDMFMVCFEKNGRLYSEYDDELIMATGLDYGLSKKKIKKALVELQLQNKIIPFGFHADGLDYYTLDMGGV